MTTRRTRFTSISAIALAGAAALSSCGGEGDSEGETGAARKDGPSSVAMGAEGEGEGEGEGGAGEADPSRDDVEYLHRLGQVRGHLVAFMALREAGAHEMARTHAKHPESELYAGLAPAFDARGLPGFADELNALLDAAAEDGDVAAAYGVLKAAIAANEPEVGVRTRLLAVAAVARTAADEFAIGVAEDGAIGAAHEYQDAYGFLSAARETVADIDASGADEENAVALVGDRLDSALAEFDELTASRTDGKAETLYGAAARIEIAALGLD